MGIRVDPRLSRAAVGNSAPGLGRACAGEDQNAEDSNAQVVISARSWAGAVYVIAVNAGDSATDATINVASLHSPTLTVLGENRRIDSIRGSFIDHFDPLAVHIYITA